LSATLGNLATVNIEISGLCINSEKHLLASLRLSAQLFVHIYSYQYGSNWMVFREI